MNTPTTPQNQLEETKVGLKTKLALLWTSLMFLYIYVDYFHLYMPGMMQTIQKGRVYEFDITQGFLTATLIAMSIPALMIFLSVALPASVNRLTNSIVAAIFIPFTLFNLAGEAWVHMYLAAAIEVVLLCCIIRYAWKWPRLQQ